MQILGLALMAVGTVMAAFVRRIIKNPVERINSDDGNYVEILTKNAMVTKIIGFIITAAGFIVFFSACR